MNPNFIICFVLNHGHLIHYTPDIQSLSRGTVYSFCHSFHLFVRSFVHSVHGLSVCLSVCQLYVKVLH